MLEIIEDRVICTKWLNQQGLHTISIAANNWINNKRNEADFVSTVIVRSCWLFTISYCKSKYLKSHVADIFQAILLRNVRHADFFTALSILCGLTLCILNSLNMSHTEF